MKHTSISTRPDLMRAPRLRHSLVPIAIGVAICFPCLLAGQEAESIELIVQDPTQYDSPADRCQARVCTSLLNLIDGAQRSIDFAAYGMRNQSALLDALIRAKARGVRIRGIVDRDLAGRNYYSSTDDWVEELGSITDDLAREAAPDDEGDFNPRCNRPAEFDGPLQCLAYDMGDSWLLAEHASREDFTDPEAGGVNRIMHNKFFIIDGRFVWTGSANISDSGTGGYNANVVVVAQSEALSALYSAEFEQLRSRTTPEASKVADGVDRLLVGAADVTVWFSPQDDAMRFGVQALIARATSTVEVAVFYLTNKWVVGELLAAHQRGVEVRVIVDATSAKNGYTKHELLRAAGIPTKVENWGGKMHMKAAVIDREFLVVGSMNWTRAGEDTNDENTLLIRSGRLANQFSGAFEQLWQSVPATWAGSYQRPDPESADSGNSCHDGVDNDFDELIDQDDPGCSPGSAPIKDLPPHRIIPKTGRAGPPASHRLYRPFGCDPSYPDWFVCLPNVPPGRDLDCPQVPYRFITVLPPDKHRFDSDGNGRGCEGPRSGPEMPYG